MTGALRAIAYRTASLSGLRVEELRCLTPEDFRLNSLKPTIYVAAASTKNGRTADQPISQALAAELRSWLADKAPGEQAFPLHHETAKAICADLEAASIAYQTKEGIADFHSLRAYYVSSLIRSGADIDTVRKLARHAKASTTLDHYAKTANDDLHGAVESLAVPTVSRKPLALTATGTDPVSNATVSTTDSEPVAVNPVQIDAFGETKRFAKPLGWVNCPRGFESPPLRSVQKPSTEPVGGFHFELSPLRCLLRLC